MRIIIVLFLCAVALVSAQTDIKLQVATWPSHAEISPNIPPDADKQSAFVSPSTLVVPPESSSIKVYFFKPGYQDTAVTVNVRSNQGNYLFVRLSPETDSIALLDQNDFQRGRTLNLWGKRMMMASLIPIAISGIFFTQSALAYKDAKVKSAQEGFPNYETYQSDYHHYKSNVEAGDKAKTRAVASLCTAGAFFLIGFTLTF